MCEREREERERSTERLVTNIQLLVKEKNKMTKLRKIQKSFEADIP